MYDYHYNKRLRPIGSTSALAFGIAIDTALNAMLTGSGDYIGEFHNAFQFDNLKDVVFDQKDLQIDLFTEEQLKQLPNDFNYQAWACLRIKGRVMLDAYKEQIFPMIEEVHGVQKKLDSRAGVLDAILTITGYGMVLVDHKTSGMPYTIDALEADTQLALYAADQKIDKVAYIVLCKTIRFNKTCRKCGDDGSTTQHKTCASDKSGVRCYGEFDRSADKSKVIQLIIGDCSEVNKNIITSSIAVVETCIDKGLFASNINSCGNMFGKRCPYYNKCWFGKDDGLVITQETKEII